MNVLGSTFGVMHGWVLALLPLAALPFVRPWAAAIPFSWLGLIPRDPLSTRIEQGLRVIGALSIAALVLAASGLHRPEYQVERIGRGAHMVLLVDRSTSMDRPFAITGLVDPAAQSKHRSKGEVARELLSQFVAERHDDLFGMVMFSTFPIPVLRLTAHHDAVHASIAAGNVGRGLAETDIGAGLEQALGYFEGKPYTGARLVVLVSDGAGEIGQTERLQIAHLMRRLRASLYWIYIRSAYGPVILDSDDPGGSTVSMKMTSERALHEFFSTLGASYRAYTAESPEGLAQAIADVNRLQNLPVRYRETIGRRDLSAMCLVLALGGLLTLLSARLLERPSW